MACRYLCDDHAPDARGQWPRPAAAETHPSDTPGTNRRRLDARLLALPPLLLLLLLLPCED